MPLRYVSIRIRGRLVEFSTLCGYITGRAAGHAYCRPSASARRVLERGWEEQTTHQLHMKQILEAIGVSRGAKALRRESEGVPQLTILSPFSSGMS